MKDLGTGADSFTGRNAPPHLLSASLKIEPIIEFIMPRFPGGREIDQVFLVTSLLCVGSAATLAKIVF
jgi:hypothetical protein